MCGFSLNPPPPPPIHGTANHKLDSNMMFVWAKLVLTGRQTRWGLCEDICTFNHHPRVRKVSKARCTHGRRIDCHCSGHLLQLTWRISPRLWTCWRTQRLKGQNLNALPQSSQVPRSQSGSRELRKTVPRHWALGHMDREVASVSFFFLQQSSFTPAFLSTIAARVLSSLLLVPGDHIGLRTHHSLGAQSIQKISCHSAWLTQLWSFFSWQMQALPSAKCYFRKLSDMPQHARWQRITMRQHRLQ